MTFLNRNCKCIFHLSGLSEYLPPVQWVYLYTVLYNQHQSLHQLLHFYNYFDAPIPISWLRLCLNFSNRKRLTLESYTKAEFQYSFNKLAQILEQVISALLKGNNFIFLNTSVNMIFFHCAMISNKKHHDTILVIIPVKELLQKYYSPDQISTCRHLTLLRK